MTETKLPNPSNRPFKVAVGAGTPSFGCACGRSKGQALGDGSHPGGSALPMAPKAKAPPSTEQRQELLAAILDRFLPKAPSARGHRPNA